MTTTEYEHHRRPIRWGIMGSSRIAQDFVHAIRDTLSHVQPQAIVTVIGARQLSDAQRVAQEFHIPHAVGSFAQVAQHPEVDVVYVATVHSAHAELALLALEHGKHVLVEKAFTINASEAQNVIDTARARKLFVMEALWSRFMPWAVKLRELLHDDAVIGPVRHVAADFGVEFPRTVRRLFEPELAGGSLLDVGVYPLSTISMVYGDQVPRSIHALGDRFDTGVDSHVSVTLSYGDGRHAQALSSAIVNTPRQAIITGTRGHIIVHDAETGYFHCSKTLTLYRHGASAPQVFHFDALPISGTYNFKHSEMLTYEIQEVHRCIAAGMLESPVMSHSATLTIMRTMDEIRRQVGVVYPSEKQ